VVLEDGGEGVAAGIGGVVPGTVVVDGPVEELEVTVGADVVDVEEVRKAHLADVKFKSPLRYLRGEGEWRALGFDELVRQADSLVDLDTGDVGRRAEVGITDDVEIGEAGETERLADTASASRFDVQDGTASTKNMLASSRS